MSRLGEDDTEAIETRRWICAGRVQGVGFRPFVLRTACRYQLAGWVRNLSGEVEILAQGAADDLNRFGAALLAEAPPLSAPQIVASERWTPMPLHGFTIRDSQAEGRSNIHIPPDTFLCADCLAEVGDPASRRYGYPFSNCTQCGPRYTLIRALPYDRAKTAMAGFPLCSACEGEYRDRSDRRFHAEPVACAACGPRLTFRATCAPDKIGEAALEACVEALQAGGIIAVKGVGGYHLMCDAADEAAVARLRQRKGRPHKPFAVMFPTDHDLASLRSCVRVQEDHEAFLAGPMRPIVLLPKRPGAQLAPGIAPGCHEIGVVLPVSPLHHLLLQAIDVPVVATSGNVSGEPIVTTAPEAEMRLRGIADAFLHHDRPIVRPVDDAVFRIILGRPRVLRLGRGIVPLEIELPFAFECPVLALGGHLKSTIALGFGQRAVVSQHLGDMDAPRSLALLQQTADDLQELYGVRAETVLYDGHPNYPTSRLARIYGLPATRILHHHAHASAVAGEYPDTGPWLVFTWDGAGFGADRTIWGGEALLGRPGRWRRVGTFRSFALPGGEKAAREPWRSASSLLWEIGHDGSPPEDCAGLLRTAWERQLNCPRTSSVGRLFDAAAALTGIARRSSFEGQAAMLLETACGAQQVTEPLALPLSCRDDDTWITDWEPLIAPLTDERLSIAERAALFHASMAQALIDQAKAARIRYGQFRLGVSGGVFQNRRLCETIARLARSEGFDFALPERIPVNDAGLSFGQLIEFGWC